MFRSSALRGARLSVGRRLVSTTVRQNSSKCSSLWFKALAVNTVLAGAVLAYTQPVLVNDDSKSKELFPDSSTTKLDELEPPVYGTLEDLEKARDEIVAIVGKENIATSRAELEHHSDTYFNSHHATEDQRPTLIIFPSSTEEVSEIMKITYKYRIPVIPFSGGTSLEGHYIPTTGTPAITMDMSKNMAKVLQLNEDDLDLVVQPGVSWEDLHDYLGEKGLLFGPDPGPGALIGGMIGTSCSGTNAARYGTMKENVEGLTVVLADGTVIKTKKRPRKSSAGYNLTGLIIGSEGTLGIVTEATLKLHVKPREETVAVVSFDSIDSASKTVQDLVQHGIQVNAVELLDDNMMKVVNASGETTRHWVEKPTLFFKIGANNKTVLNELISEVRSISHQNHSSHFEFAKNQEEISELWSARKMALWSTINMGRQQHPDTQVWTTDVAVPISKLASVLSETKADMESSGLTATLVGHAGDGNFHAFLLYTPDQRAIAEKLVQNMVKRAIDVEGTCTGEHGVGYGKREFLLEELGEEPIDMMRRIKMALDPRRLLNPDKVFKINPNDHEH
ncbi:DLD1 [Cyberlindnera jadinii]|uniref:D-lactate dehydrogenase (cytochrome) n=1 Tax=Cyberlindnera jadinii (strain ATCC 18201 / CBS 1600 / BCRC 20928 / JCM 3617 / NBRC 0987 / NRRL Y-1542) TaxID=983966 RepID=A0A0H5C5S0_CYBJN|nr:DLD1 [Cyberlindnera jadinii]